MALIIPSFKYPRKIARRADESAYPNLWKGLVGSWVPNLQKPNTSRLFDISGQDNHGTLNGAMTNDDWVVGPCGYALDFDGSNDYVNIPGSSVLQIGGSLCSGVVWVRGNLDARRFIFGKSTSATEYGMEYTGAAWRAWHNGAFVNSGVTPTAVQTMLCFSVLNATTLGISVNARTFTTTATTLGGTTSDALVIGRRGTSASNYWSGDVSGLLLYSRALSASEILAMYQGASPHTYKYEPKLIGKVPKQIIKMYIDYVKLTRDIRRNGGNYEIPRI